MRYRLIGLVMAICCLPQSIRAQDITLQPPTVWTDSDPTARGFAMGFSGLATTVPSVYNPASLGMWSQKHGVHQMHNWETGAPAEGVAYDFSNTVEAIGARWTPNHMERPPTFSAGFLVWDGRSHAGPVPSMTGFDEQIMLTEAQTMRSAALGVGVDAGFIVGLGLGFDHIDRDLTYWYPETPDDVETASLAQDAHTNSGYVVRLPVFHAIRQWGIADLRPRVAGVSFDVYLSHAGILRDGSGAHGYAVGLESDYRDLPVLSIAYTRDFVDAWESFGGEVSFLGAVAVRMGNRDENWPVGTFYDSHGEIVVEPDWTTVGYALDFGNAQRWVRRALDIETSRTLGWILDHIDARYEAASFRHPDQAPPGLGQVTVRQWTVGLRSL